MSNSANNLTLTAVLMNILYFTRITVQNYHLVSVNFATATDDCLDDLILYQIVKTSISIRKLTFTMSLYLY